MTLELAGICSVPDAVVFKFWTRNRPGPTLGVLEPVKGTECDASIIIINNNNKSGCLYNAVSNRYVCAHCALQDQQNVYMKFQQQ